MSNHLEISSDLFQALFLNEDIFWVESDKPITRQNLNLEVNSRSGINTGVVEIVNVETKITATMPEMVVAKSQSARPEIVQIKTEIVDSEIVEKRIIPLLLITDSISEAEKIFLEKVLNAVKLSLTDVEVFATDLLKTTDFRTYSRGKTYQRIISFGVPFSKIGMTKMFMPYEITNIKSIQFLMTEELVVIENDIAHKRMFWGCLQKMF